MLLPQRLRPITGPLQFLHFNKGKKEKHTKGVERGEESLKSCVGSESLVSVVNHSQKQVPLMH